MELNVIGSKIKENVSVKEIIIDNLFVCCYSKIVGNVV